MKFIIIFLLMCFTLKANSLIDQRQNSMNEIKELLQSSGAYIKGQKIDPTMAALYERISIIMLEFPTLFSAESLKSPSKANKNIIEEKPIFTKLAEDTSMLAAKARIAVMNHDMAMLLDSHHKLLNQCQTCHSRYRE